MKTKDKIANENNGLKHTYLGFPFNFFHILLLSLSGLALIDSIILLIIMISTKNQKFFFDINQPLTIIFFILVGLMFVSLLGVVVVFTLGRDLMPTYDEYKRAKNRVAYVKQKTRFPELTSFDLENKHFIKEESEKDITLKSFVDNFRTYLANELKLYYSKEDLIKFVASLSVSKIMILQGMSGTGKTSIAVAFGKYINSPSVVVPVQPMWKEKSDLLGYYNEFTGKFNETTILKKIYESTFSDKINIIILDEANIARIEYYFSEFLSLLELPATADRKVVVSSTGSYGDPIKMDRGKILLPDNVWFLGTANNDDSTFSISDKVYDRAMVMNLNKKAPQFECESVTPSTHLSCTDFKNLCEEAKQKYKISDDSLKLIKKFDKYLVSTFHITFGNRIMVQIKNYIPVFVACGGTEIEAIDDIISKKILRKLETLKPVFVKNKSQELKNKLNEVFGEDVMKDCLEFIDNLINNL